MRPMKSGAGRIHWREPPELPGYFWSDLRVNAPWRAGSTTDEVVVGLGPDGGIALFDRATGIIHRKANAKPN